MDFKQGDIVLLPFPFDDLTTIKKRPALVVSSNKFNRISKTVIVVEITSNVNSGFQELNVLIDNKDVELYPGAKPIIPSVVKPYVIFSINTELIIKRIGMLKEKKLEEVFSRLKQVVSYP
ncbi:type II toxin-antitoxin system PemK/MazF family toxin [Methanothermococcus okinawensis]|uniref:Transcriptional modulator of MazE/toxin, MazF n=1 Tax=Methanothermococcus okinawensis (strain DSM 14208 / JCM 11175 / IH1) TaxID=647113 RepID=F8AP23_METOI|nr:type II toxin-antitoxin system PemK/MazF family toxin [Methanothermococcus okinawensis]AEH07591.1 transcriptional modulator of MazE/toxin, MazF [Methanothermococcus okinawensis IH1]